AQRDRAAAVAGFRQLDPQLLGGVGLGVQAGLEVQARREIEVGVRWAREAAHAAVLAAAIGIDRLAEANVGRLVATDDAARAFLGHAGVRVRWRLDIPRGIGPLPRRAPAVVLAARDPLLEAAVHVRRSAAPLGRAVHRQ